jgi:hypothetical protein
MHRDFERKQVFDGVMKSHDIATMVRYMRVTRKPPTECLQLSWLVDTKCLFCDRPKYSPSEKPTAKDDSARIINPFMGRSFRCSLAKKHILGASIVCQEAGIKARLQKGLHRDPVKWSCALIFATHTTNSAEPGASRPSPGSLLSGERS